MRSCFTLFRPFLSSSPKIPEEINLKAIESFNSGDIDKAKTLYEESIKLFEKKGEYKSVAIVYSNLALLHFNKKNYEEAINCYEKSQQFFEKDGYSFLDIPRLKLKIASCYFEKNNFPMASSFIEDALRTADEPVFSNNNRTLVEIYSNAGNLYMKMNAKKAPQTSISMEYPLLMDVENSLLTTQIMNNDPPSPIQSSIGKDSSSHSQNTQEIAPIKTEDIIIKNENKFLSKSIQCLYKSLINEGRVIDERKNRIKSDYNLRGNERIEYCEGYKKDFINYISNSLNLGLALKENNDSEALKFIEHFLQELTKMKKNINEFSEGIKFLETNKDKIYNFVDKISFHDFKSKEKKSMQRICQNLLAFEKEKESMERICQKLLVVEEANKDKIYNFVDKTSVHDFNSKEKESMQRICQNLLVIEKDEEKREKINEKIKLLTDLPPSSRVIHSRAESPRLVPESSSINDDGSGVFFGR